MSPQGIGALERGDRRTPQRETLALLIEALALAPEHRVAFEAAALRQSVPRRDATQSAVIPLIVASPTLLPVSLTSFVGREVDVEEIAGLVLEHRLVTITGPGGIGKTRAALDVARVLSDDSADDVRLVELAALHDSALVVNAVLSVFNLGGAPNRDPFDTLRAHLEQRRVVLVVDSCEHVIAETAHVVERLLRACPLVKVLATSREPLRVLGEHVYRLPSLRTPSLEQCGRIDAAQAATFPAIRLFADRARSVNRSFVLDDERAPVVAEICAHLDGIPLAIELAAARVTALSLPALAANLRRQFTLLGGGGRTAHSRQQTMRATIDWSFDLLEEPERRLFTCLAVFAGGWTIDAAVAVAVAGAMDDEDVERFRVFDLLSSLVDKSLVVADLGGPVPRYRMLEPFRQYAREKLVEREELDSVSRRHAAAYLTIAEEFWRTVGLNSAGPEYAVARLDIDNWRAALEWCLVARNDVRTGQLIASKLRMIWGTFATIEGRRWTRLALEAGGAETPPDVAAVLERIDAFLSVKLGEFEAALAAATRAVSHQSTLGDEIETARAELELGSALFHLGRLGEAERCLQGALKKARTNGAAPLAAKILYLTAETLGAGGKFDEARAACTQAFGMYPIAKGDRWFVSVIVRAEIECWAGDCETALRLALEALLEIPSLGENEGAEAHEATIRANAAAYLISLERYGEARRHAYAALEIAARLRFPLELVWSLQHLAAISILDAQCDDRERRREAAERAARLLGSVSKRYDDLGAALGTTEQREFDRVLAALRLELSADRLASLQARGAAMNDDEAIAEAFRV